MISRGDVQFQEFASNISHLGHGGGLTSPF